MVRGGALIWPLRIGLIACCVVVPWLAGPWYAAVMLLALPILRALLDATHEHAVARVAVLGGCLCAAWLLPAWSWPVTALWGLGLLAMSFLRVRPGSHTLLAGLILSAGTAMLALAAAAVPSDGQIIPWLARLAVNGIDRHPNSAGLLLSLYQSGLARLKGDLALLPALRLFNTVIIPADVRVEMLRSLQYSFERLLESYLPRALTGWMLATALLSALAAEAGVRSLGRRSNLPPPGEWHVPPSWNAGVIALLLTSFLPYLTAAPVLLYLSGMASTLGYWAIALQGASLAVCLLLERGFRPAACGIIVALGVTGLPLALFFLGVYDQFRDPRHLRGSRDETI